MPLRHPDEDGSEDAEDAEDLTDSRTDGGEDTEDDSGDDSATSGDDEPELDPDDFDGSEEDPEVEDNMDALREGLDAEAARERDLNGGWCPSPDIVACDSWEKPKAGPCDDAKYRAVKAEVRPQISTMKTRLVNKLRTRSADYNEGDKMDGDIDTAALASIRTGERAVFTHLVEGSPLDTCVTVLVDESGSMAWSGKAVQAQKSAIALSETFDALRIPFEVIGFNNTPIRHNPTGKSTYTIEYEARNWDRHMPFQFNLFKEFGERYQATKERLVHIKGREQNVDGEALLQVAYRVAARRERRKIIMVLSDGLPCGGGDYYKMCKHLHQVIRQVTSVGIEVYGVGIDSPEISDYYNAANGSQSINVTNINELAPKVLSLFGRAVMG